MADELETESLTPEQLDECAKGLAHARSIRKGAISDRLAYLLRGSIAQARQSLVLKERAEKAEARVKELELEREPA